MHVNARRLCFLSVVIYVVVNLARVLGGNASKYMPKMWRLVLILSSLFDKIGLYERLTARRCGVD